MAKRKGSRLEQKQGKRWTLPAGSKVWAYLRHSPGDAQNIDSQQSGLRQWCAEIGLIIDHEFIDEGVEGSKEQRENFQEMMSLAKQTPRPVDGIVVWSLSRFARDQMDAAFYKAWLRKLGYVIVSKADDLPDNEMAPLMEAFIDLKNQRFLDDMSVDVRRGLLFLVERGFMPGAVPPVGYRIEKEEIGRRRNGEMRYGNRLVKDEGMADRIALAWRMKLQDNASYMDIHKITHLFANKHNYGYFFDNWLYAGIFVYDGKRYPLEWEQGARFCEPYVSVDEFWRVQQNRQARRIDVVAPRSLASHYLLTGLLHCSFCAENGLPSTMAGGGHSDNSSSSRFYRCISHASGRSPNCDMPHVACWKVDDVVIETLREMVLTPDYVRSEVEHANERLAKKGVNMSVQLRQAERLVSVQERRVLSLVALIEKKTLTPLLERQYDEANAAYLDATRQLAQLRSESVQTQVKQIVYTDIERSLEELVKILDTGTLRQKQELVRRFVERVDVYSERVHIKLRFRLDDVVQIPMPSMFATNQSYGSLSRGE